MPARRNRPNKHGTEQPPQLTADSDERRLVEKLIACESFNPMRDHWVSWLDMAAAKRLVKYGYLREGNRATGCFEVTDAFRQKFMRP